MLPDLLLYSPLVPLGYYAVRTVLSLGNSLGGAFGEMYEKAPVEKQALCDEPLTKPSVVLGIDWSTLPVSPSPSWNTYTTSTGSYILHPTQLPSNAEDLEANSAILKSAQTSPPRWLDEYPAPKKPAPTPTPASKEEQKGLSPDERKKKAAESVINGAEVWELVKAKFAKRGWK